MVSMVWCCYKKQVNLQKQEHGWKVKTIIKTGQKNTKPMYSKDDKLRKRIIW